MGVLKKNLIPLLLIPAFASADMESFVTNKVGGSYQSVGPGYFKTSTHQHQTFGQIRIRWSGNGAATNIVNIRPPSMSQGCDGIDISFGSFSFLDPDQFVEKAKQIAQIAPAFAFKMALSTLCKECDTIMTELEAAINMINGLTLDSCGIAESAGNIMGEAIGTSVRAGNSPDYLKGLRGIVSDPAQRDTTFQEYYTRLKDAMGGDWDLTGKRMGYGSLIDAVIEKQSFFGAADKAWVQQFARSMYGDVIVLHRDTDGTSHAIYIPPEFEPNSIVKMFINGTGGVNPNLKGRTVRLKNGGQHFPVAYWLDDGISFWSANGVLDKGAEAIIKDQIDSIRNSIKGKTQLSPGQVDFLNALHAPIWKAVNIEVSYFRHGDSSNVLSDEIIKTLGIMETRAFFAYIGVAVQMGTHKAIAEMDFMADDSVREKLNYFAETARALNKIYFDSINSIMTETGAAPLNGLNEMIAKAEKNLKRNALVRMSGWVQ